MPVRTLTATVETWPLARAFIIARGAKTEAHVVVASVSEGMVTGRGECVPYPRYGESVESVRNAILTLSGRVRSGLSRQDLQSLLPPGAARNALDCALWDLEAKLSGKTVFELAGRGKPAAVQTAFTISLDAPDVMAAAAGAAHEHGLLKLKLGAACDAERLAAVRAARPDARLIADANEGWAAEETEALLRACAHAGVELVEQPLPAGEDAVLAEIGRAVPVCADESVHTRDDLETLAGRYDAVNIKLDKAGGLTEALALERHARAAGFRIMAGCMVSTSLAMAPALLLAQTADFVDLDGPLLLARDRVPGLFYDGDTVSPPEADLWG